MANPIAMKWIRKITSDWMPHDDNPDSGTWLYNDARANSYAATHWAQDLDVRARLGSAYEVLLGRAPDADGWKYWVDEVETRSFGRVLEDLWVAAKINREAFTPATAPESWAQGLFHLFLDRDPNESELAFWSAKAGSTAFARMKAASDFMTSQGVRFDISETPTLLRDLKNPVSLNPSSRAEEIFYTDRTSQSLVERAQEDKPAVVVIDNGWHGEAVIQCIREFYSGPVIFRDVGADSVKGSELHDQIRWALDHADELNIKVINLSWADSPGVAENQWSEYHDFTDLYAKVAAKGISFVVAAGNHASMTFKDDQWNKNYWELTSGLGDSSYAFTVSALRTDAILEAFAPYNATVDFYAPDRVRYVGSDPEYSGKIVAGTSFATPRVAGAIAAIEAAASEEGYDIGLAEIRSLLRLGSSYDAVQRYQEIWVSGKKTEVLDYSFGALSNAIPVEKEFWRPDLSRSIHDAGSVWQGEVEPRVRVASAYDFLLGRAPDADGWRFWVDHLEDFDFSSVLNSIWLAAKENEDFGNAQSEVAEWVSAMFVLFLDRFPTDQEYVHWIGKSFQDIAPQQYSIVPRTLSRADAVKEFLNFYKAEVDIDFSEVGGLLHDLGLNGSVPHEAFRDVTPAGLKGYDLPKHEGWQPFSDMAALESDNRYDVYTGSDMVASADVLILGLPGESVEQAWTLG